MKHLKIARAALAGALMGAVAMAMVFAQAVHASSDYLINTATGPVTCTSTSFSVNISLAWNLPASGTSLTKLYFVNGVSNGSQTDLAAPTGAGNTVGIDKNYSSFGPFTTYTYVTKWQIVENGAVIAESDDTVTCNNGVGTVTFANPLGSPGGASDNRLDPGALAGPVALYCDDDTLNVYADSSGEGVFLFDFSAWPAEAPAVNTLLKQVGHVSLWHLATGEFQVNADQGEGKIYAFVFNGCPYNGGGYHANLDPNE